MILLFFASCQQQESQKDDLKEYQLTKTDSFRIYNLLPVDLFDHDPESGRYIGYTHQDELVLISSTGEIIQKQKKMGEGPEEFSSSPLLIGFHPTGEIEVQTQNEMVMYYTAFRQTKRIRFEPGPISLYYSRGKTIRFGVPDQSSYLLGISGVHSFGPLKKEQINALQLLEYYHGQRQEIKSVIDLNDMQVYQDIEENASFLITPVFAYEPRKRNFI